MIADMIATLIAIAVIAWGIYAARNVHEYPEWFEEDVMWGAAREDSRGSGEGKQKVKRDADK